MCQRCQRARSALTWAESDLRRAAKGAANGVIPARMVPSRIARAKEAVTDARAKVAAAEAECGGAA